MARHLVDYIGTKAGQLVIPGEPFDGFDWLHPTRRETTPAGYIGGERPPVVIATQKDAAEKGEALSPKTHNNADAPTSGKHRTDKPKADYIYIGGNPVSYTHLDVYKRQRLCRWTNVLVLSFYHGLIKIGFGTVAIKTHPS